MAARFPLAGFAKEASLKNDREKRTPAAPSGGGKKTMPPGIERIFSLQCLYEHQIGHKGGTSGAICVSLWGKTKAGLISG